MRLEMSASRARHREEIGRSPRTWAAPRFSSRWRGVTQVKVSEIFQVETPHAPGGLEGVLSAIAASGLVLAPCGVIKRAHCGRSRCYPIRWT